MRRVAEVNVVEPDAVAGRGVGPAARRYGSCSSPSAMRWLGLVLAFTIVTVAAPARAQVAPHPSWSVLPWTNGVASAAYSFLRFAGAAVAPWLAGVLGERISVHVPFWVGAGAVALGAVVLMATRPHLAGVDEPETAVEEMQDEVVGALT